MAAPKDPNTPTTGGGATRLAMSLVVVPPGGEARPHYHLASETIIHVLKGRAETRYGQQLSQSVISEAGDFLFIGANVPHAPRNLSDTEASIAINARNDPSQQEAIVPIDPDDTLEVNWDKHSMRTRFDGGYLTPNLLLERKVLAPGETNPPYVPSEMAWYIVEGVLKTEYDYNFEHTAVTHAGEFLFIPRTVMLSLTTNVSDQPATVVIARCCLAEFMEQVRKSN